MLCSFSSIPNKKCSNQIIIKFQHFKYNAVVFSGHMTTILCEQSVVGIEENTTMNS